MTHFILDVLFFSTVGAIVVGAFRLLVGLTL